MSIRETAARGAAWLRQQMEPDGALRGAQHLDAYYKTPCALAFAGQPQAAQQVLAQAKRRFLRQAEAPAADLDGTGVSWFPQYRIYPHAWLLWAAAELDNAPLANALAAFLLARQNAASGGFTADANGTEEMMTTSMAGIALLRAGHRDAALAAGAWLERMWQAQPDPTRGLWHVWRPGTGLYAGDGSAAYRVDAGQPRQWYFQYGITAALLAELARTTGGHRWLGLAREYLHASRHCAADRYATPQSGKLGWGAAWVYRLTRGAEERALLTEVAAGLAALQGGDGSWNAEGVYDATPAPDTAAARFDVTSEFVALTSIMSAAIEGDLAV